ncbi:hypothetical protein [Pseudomonas phage UF_RH9]|nr:hypothetical protein [Pseudomonas phage UF_RH9]
MIKPQRWYEITEEEGRKVLNVYDAPYKEQATSSSHTKPEDLQYYRTNFKLEKLWKE